MFSKLVKYDLRAIFKYWWIAAVTSAVLSVVGGFCVRLLNNEINAEEYVEVQVFAGLGLFIVIMGLVLFYVLTEVLILLRFYKHFFTDEGYLTFTLPVRKTSLFNSKVLSSMIFICVTQLALVLEVFVILAIGLPEYIFSPKLLNGLAELARMFVEDGLLYNIIILFEIIVILTALQVLGMLFIYICITIAAVIAKKHKVLAAIGIYYAANSALSFIIQTILFTNGFSRIFELIDALPVQQMQISSSLTLLGFIGVLGIMLGLMYLLATYLLDRRLNLE